MGKFLRMRAASMKNKDGGKWRNFNEFCLTLVAMQSGSQIRSFGCMCNIPTSTEQNKGKHNNIMLNLIGNNLKLYDMID